MKTMIILLRGVMPTGKNRVLMAPLRAVLEEAGLTDVRTYIQSGNVLACTTLGRSATEDLVHDAISKGLGAEISVLARPASYFRKAIGRGPFRDADPARLYFTLLSSRPAPALLESFRALDFSPDQVQVVDDMAYVQCATKYSDLKANNSFIERKLQLRATTRNFNTLSKLVALSRQE